LKLTPDQQDLIREVQRTMPQWRADWAETAAVLMQYLGLARNNNSTYRTTDPVLQPLLESAQATIVPPDLTFTVSKDESGKLNLVPETAEKWLNNLKKNQDWIAEFRRACILALVTGRCFLYVAKEVQFTANSKNARSTAVPSIRVAHYEEVFFPRTAQRRRELPWVASRRCTYGRTLALLYPGRKEDIKKATDPAGLVEIVEIVDRVERQIIRYMRKDQFNPLEIITGKDYWDPWIFATLGDDASSILGVSSFRTAAKLAQNISVIFQRLLEIVNMQVPIQFADTGQLDEAALAQIARADPGDILNVKVRVPEGGSPIPILQNAPTVEINPQMVEIFRTAKQELEILTGISGIQRGQTVGARTATEISLIEMQTRSVGQMRQVSLYDAFRRAGAMCLALDECSFPTQEDVDLYLDRLDLSAASASELNRAVIAERFANQILPFVLQNPGEFDMDKFFDLFIHSYGLDPSIRLSPEAKANLAKQQALTQVPNPESNPNEEPQLQG